MLPGSGGWVLPGRSGLPRPAAAAVTGHIQDQVQHGRDRQPDRGAADLWVPVIRSKSCGLRILMDQPTESISSHDPPSRHGDS